MPQEEPNANYPLCVAVYDNLAESGDELSFIAGEILVVLEQDSAGLEGWWVCSLKGRQGICPSNRLRILTEAEQTLKKQAWQSQNKIPVASTAARTDGAFLYDSPVQRHGSTPQPSTEQYDVPQTVQTVQGVVVEESYDTPKPVSGVSLAPRGTASLTPSSSISSLTTDSNRSSLIQQDYDVPRPLRVQPPQGVYDVPKGGEVTLDMTAALEWLGRLEADVTGAISRLLGLATAGWRTRAKMEPRIAELRGSVCRLTSSLHDLTVFSHAVLATHHDTGLGGKLGPLVAALNKADLQVKDCVHKLEAIGWSVNKLSIDEPSVERDSDTLDKLVQTAAAVTDDIRAIASFIQGNSTLLFKRNVPQTPEDGQYMNLSGGRGGFNGEYVGPTSNASIGQSVDGNGTNGRNKSSEQVGEIEDLPVLSPRDRKIVERLGPRYYLLHFSLRQTIDGFLATVTNNQPPKAFLSQCKLVVMTANQLLQVVEAIERSLENAQMKTEIASYNRVISDALSSLSSKTITAATHFPSVRAVQRMVDAVEGLVPLPQQIWRILATAG